jgi:hypothetical protein
LTHDVHAATFYGGLFTPFRPVVKQRDNSLTLKQREEKIMKTWLRIKKEMLKRTVLTISLLIIPFMVGLQTRLAHATPSTEFWTPAIMDVQPYGVWHLGIDNYFTIARGPSPSQLGVGTFPTDVGLTVGVLPFSKLNLEIGVDLLEPVDPLICQGALSNGTQITSCPNLGNALLFNFKFGVPEGALFPESPGINLGMFNIGTVNRVTNMDIADLIVGKTIPMVGRLHVGGYFGNSDSALLHEGGDDANPKKTSGVMVGFDRGFMSVKDKEGNEYNKFYLLADYASGKNAIGGGGVGLGVYFTKDIDILTGPVFFNDQVINGRWKWSTQLDINF